MPDSIYRNPGAYGLEVVGEVEWYEPCYSFDTTVVWKLPNGRKPVFYWASDSGCSCPSPFEGLTDIADCESGTAHDAANALTKMLTANNVTHALPQVAELVSRIMR